MTATSTRKLEPEAGTQKPGTHACRGLPVQWKRLLQRSRGAAINVARCSRTQRVNASLASTHQPNVVDEIVSLGKVTIATGAVASQVEGPAACSARHG
jgi:hypothetical protein